jgi:hypothetical protein
MNPLSQSIVPENIQGKPSDMEHSITPESREEAVHVFSIAAQRMLDVNSWHRIGSSVSAKFDLTDFERKTLERPAVQGDFIRIDILGPGSSVAMVMTGYASKLSKIIAIPMPK